MKRAGLLVGLAAVAVLAVLGYLWWEEQGSGTTVVARLTPENAGPREEPPEVTPAKPEQAEGSPPQGQIANISPKQDAEDVEEAAPAKPSSATQPRIETREVAPPSDPSPVVVLPSFDIVRVEPNGEAVLAGRATPGSLVKLLDGGRVLTEAVTDSNGEWVIVLRRALAPGTHELSLESHLSSGEILLSENVVVVSVPEPRLVASAPGEPAAPDADLPAASSPTEAEAESPARAVETETVRPLAVLMSRRGEGASRIIQSPEPVPRNLGKEVLLLETVDYDAAGRALIGGRGKAGVTVIVYLNGRYAGRAVIGENGRWQVLLDGQVPYGVHTLRVDQVDASGRVVARVESPFSRAEIQTAMTKETAVIVQPGNSLWRIARRIYGDGFQYSVIFDANRTEIGDPDLIYPGQVFVVPRAN